MSGGSEPAEAILRALSLDRYNGWSKDGGNVCGGIMNEQRLKVDMVCELMLFGISASLRSSLCVLDDIRVTIPIYIVSWGGFFFVYNRKLGQWDD